MCVCVCVYACMLGGKRITHVIKHDQRSVLIIFLYMNLEIIHFNEKISFVNYFSKKEKPAAILVIDSSNINDLFKLINKKEHLFGY